MKVLVANRGEIACRILRTLRTLAVPSVAVYTPEDGAMPHVWLADAAVALDPGQGPRGYLHVPSLLAAARQAGATAIHPGYGFLSQSAAFAGHCAAAGLTFVGPGPQAMAQLGDKRRARQLAVDLGVPVVPGEETCNTVAEAAAAAAAVGFPVLIKAAGGGGGKGMRRVDCSAELPAAFAAATREATAAFDDPRLLVEKCIYPARHVEIQVLADGVRAVALGERECSLQRRYQKIIEESPAPVLTAAQRTALQTAAVALVEAVGYVNAATVEFLVDAAGEFYFLEVNTRLQVEHPVTEMCRNIDLVAAQIALAGGCSLAEVDTGTPRGHAIEVRLNAENPDEQFLPSSGRILAAVWPQGPNVRVDAGVEVGSQVGVAYDNLLAKIIVWAPTRALCRRRLIGALEELILLGVHTNQAFLLRLLQSPEFAAGETYTHLVEAQPWPADGPPPAVLAAGRAALAAHNDALHAANRAPRHAAGEGHAPWSRLGKFRVGPCGK